MEPLDGDSSIKFNPNSGAVDISIYKPMKIPIRRCCVCGKPCFMCVSYGGISTYPVHEGVCLRKLIKDNPEKFEVEELPKGSKFVFR